MALQLQTAPGDEPISVAQAKDYLRVDGAAHDADINRLVKAARQRFENETGRALAPQSWDWMLDGFDTEAFERVPRPALISVDSIGYIDETGATRTLAPSVYRVDRTNQRKDRGRITLAYGQTWPGLRGIASQVTVRFSAGYSGVNALPADIVEALLLMIGHWFENREAVNVGNIVNTMPMGAEDIIADYRVWTF